MKLMDKNQGAGLLEVVVALTIFSIALAVVPAALTAGLGLTLRVSNETTAVTLATSQLEDTLAQPYVELADYPIIPATGGFSVAFDNFVIDPILLQRIKVTISKGSETLIGLTTHKVNDNFVAAPPVLRFSQRDFRWFENKDSLILDTPLADESAPFAITDLGQVARLRMSVETPRLPLASGDQVFKLQYSTDIAGPWTDVGAIGSTGTWRGFDNPAVLDGNILPTLLLSLSDVAETYEEENPSAVNPNPLGSRDFGEWDWVIQENGAPSNTIFFFRMLRSDGTIFESYTRYPSTVMPPPPTRDQFDYRWFANIDNLDPTTPLAGEHVPLNATTHGGAYRLRMNVAVDGLNLNTGDQAFKLQYATSTQSTRFW